MIRSASFTQEAGSEPDMRAVELDGAGSRGAWRLLSRSGMNPCSIKSNGGEIMEARTKKEE
jgi:hypothetical protein